MKTETLGIVSDELEQNWDTFLLDFQGLFESSDMSDDEKALMKETLTKLDIEDFENRIVEFRCTPNQFLSFVNRIYKVISETRQGNMS